MHKHKIFISYIVLAFVFFSMISYYDLPQGNPLPGNTILIEDEIGMGELSVYENYLGKRGNGGKGKITWLNCSDSDGGKDFYNYGEVTATYSYRSEVRTNIYSDSCKRNRVIEYSCEGNKYIKSSTRCKYGCLNGECEPKPGSGPVCGDDVCEGDETCNNCPGDCGSCPINITCGDGDCENGENCVNCPSDCGSCPITCGDGNCDVSESCNVCPQDCGECPQSYEVGRFATWCGKVNTHIDPSTGNWVVDSDCNSGCDINDVNYCRKFYPETDYVQIITEPSGVEKPFTTGGCLTTYYEVGQEYACIKEGVPEHVCGDGTCSGYEICSTCPSDCGECPSCSDSDGGIRIGTRGTVSGIFNGMPYENIDYCLDNILLIEYYCSGDYAYDTNISCSGNVTCNNGICI